MRVGSSSWRALIENGARQLNLAVNNSALDGLSLHAKEMVKFNQKMNLTTIIDPYDIALKHIVDSIAVAPYIDKHRSLLDIGSGAGFPGIPLKLIKPDMTVTLIDGVTRKVSFLKHVIRQLDVTGLKAIHSRAEHLGGVIQAGPFDVVITRAVAPLQKCWELSVPLVNSNNGILIALRGHVDKKEIELLRHKIRNHAKGILKRYAWTLTAHPYQLPFVQDQRTIVIHRFMPS